MNKVDPQTVTEDQHRQAIAQCVEVLRSSSEFTVGASKQQRFLVIHSLVATTFAMVEASLLLIDSDMVAAAVPNVRSAFEHAITIQWLHRQPGAVEDFVNESQRHTNAVLRTGVGNLGWDVPQELLDRMHEKLPKIDGRIGKFEQMCREFDPTDGLDVYYRGLSSQTHPTMEAAAHYVFQKSDGEIGLLTRSKMDDTAHLIWACALSSVLALACREDLVRTKPNKSRVVKIAASVGMKPFPRTTSHVKVS